MGWMTGSGNITYLKNNTPKNAQTFFDTASSFCTGASLTANPTPGGFKATPVLNLSSYTAPAPSSGSPPGGLAALLANGATDPPTTPYIQYAYKWIAYDNENQPSTPSVESAKPPVYMQDFVTACHGNGYLACLLPGYDLFGSAQGQYPLNPGELQWQWFVRVIVGMGAINCDMFVLQNESQENMGGIFEDLWNATVAKLASVAPNAQAVFADVSSTTSTGSTAQDLGANMAANAVTLTSPYPDGFYIAMPNVTGTDTDIHQAAGRYFVDDMVGAGYSGLT
jgi:hypothetical protein